MSIEDSSQRHIGAVRERTRMIVESLAGLSDDQLHEASELPQWSRLTIACHLRFGAEALDRMTHMALQGLPVAYYPEGRPAQRPRTLEPLPGESPQDVVASLSRLSGALDRQWSTLSTVGWRVAVDEPPDNPDLGPLPLASLPLLRLTEVEVHGTDLGLHLADWSTIFISTVLPMRLEWLNERRANHRAFDATLEGSWLLVATDGPTYEVTVHGPEVTSRSASPDDRATAVIRASSRDLLALLLGRAPVTAPVMEGDVAFGRSFSRAFPGP